MAGPTACVLLPKPADSERVAAIIEDNFETMEMNARSPGTNSDAALDGLILIARHPFFVVCGLEYEERLEDLDLAGLTRALGWPPVDEVRIAAMRNTPEDHLLLARVCIVIAEQFGGIVDFGGKPWNLSEEVVAQIPGRVLALRSFDAGEAMSDELLQFYGDATFLRNWMKHPDFRMVK